MSWVGKTPEARYAGQSGCQSAKRTEGATRVSYAMTKAATVKTFQYIVLIVLGLLGLWACKGVIFFALLMLIATASVALR